MLRIIFILCIVFKCVVLICQVRLDSLYTIAQHDSRGDVIALDGDEIIVVGSARDASTAAVGIAFSRFAFDGEMLVSSYEFDSLQYFARCNELIIQDSFVYVAPHMSWPPRYLLKYNRYTGAILDKIVLPISQASYSIIAPQALDRIDENRFAFSSILLEGNKPNETQITIYDMRDGSMRHILNQYSGYNQNINHITWREDRIWIMGDLYKGDPNEAGFQSRLTIAILDTMGNEQWRYVSDSMRAKVSDCIVEDNGDVVITHSFGKNYDLGNDWWVPSYRPGVSKISADGKIIWECPLGLNHYCDDGFWNFMRTMLPTPDGDGYVLAGIQSNFSTEEYWSFPYVDTLSNGENFQQDALIAKVSNNGEIVWQRTYSKVGQVYSADRIDDMIYHPQGGYLMSGMVGEYIPGQPLVRTWLLYVDEYGCAVPGCQTVSTINPVNGVMPLLLYPNPASSDLYVYQGENKTYFYTIIDLSGKILERFKGSTGGHTFIVNVSEYQSGTYVISRQDEDGKTVSEKWIKR